VIEDCRKMYHKMPESNLNTILCEDACIILTGTRTTDH